MARHETNWIWRLLAEIIFGEESLPSTKPAKPLKPGRRPRPAPFSLRPFAAQEGGTVTLATVVVVMIIVVLVALVVNTGMATVEKVEMQNGADSIAYSESLWMARGMNTITAANHLIGEATAVVVVLDAFGGPEQDEGKDLDDSSFSSMQNNKIKLLQGFGPYIDPVPFDKVLVDKVIELFTRDNGKHQAGAMIYDAQLTLKFTLQMGLSIKAVCAMISRITTAIPVVNVIVKVATIAIHLAIDALIVKMAQEWIMIKGIEYASKGTPLIKRTLRELMIPALSEYQDFVAGREPGGQSFSNDKFGGSPIARAAGDTINRLATAHQFDSAAVYSAGKKWRLPVIPEPLPKGGAGQSSQPPSEWDGDDWDAPFKALQELGDKLKNTIGRVTKYFDLLSKWTSFGLLDFVLPDEWKPSAFAKMLDFAGGPDDKGYTNNPSRKKLPKFDWQSERRDQYMRGTYPMVDSLRSPVREFCKDFLSISNASTWFVHWTNRYTSVEVHNRRITPSPLAAGQPHMYLMRDSSPQKKGYEPWAVENDPEKENSAEKIFTMVAFAWRQKGEPMIGAPLFRNPNNEGRLTYSMSMYYNANGRKVPKTQPAPGLVQPNTGWDTLNWLPPVDAPEWGAPPRDGSDVGLWKIVSGNVPANRGAQVRLNWQAKLMPITETRLLKAVADADLPDEISKSAKLISKFPELIHH